MKSKFKLILISVFGFIGVYALLLMFPDAPEPTKTKIIPGVTAGTEWMKEFKKKSIHTIMLRNPLSSKSGYTTDSKKIMQIIKSLKNSYRLKVPYSGKFDARLQIIFIDGTDWWIKCKVSKTKKIIYGKEWASSDLYNLLCKDGNYDWSYFEPEPKKQNTKD